MLNKARELMNERERMINEAKEVLVVLNAVDNNVITKTVEKIIEVPVEKIITKEVEVDTTCFQETIAAKEKYIATLESQIEEMNEQFIIVEEQNIELENQLSYKDGQLFAKDNTIKQLTKEIEKIKDDYAKLLWEKEQLEGIDHIKDNSLNYIFEQANEAMNNMEDEAVEEDDAMEEPEFVFPKLEDEELQYQNDYEIKRIYGLMNLHIRRGNIELAKEQAGLLEQARRKADETLGLTWIAIHPQDKNGNLITSRKMGVKGSITIDGKEYRFITNDQHNNPTVYGAMSMDVINKAKEILTNNNIFRFSKTNRDEVIYNFEDKMVIWITPEGVVKGYTDKYAFVWDRTKSVPCAVLNKHAVKDDVKYRAMTNSWGKGIAKLGDKIMDVANELFFNTNDNNAEDTNEIVVNTNEETNNTNEERSLIDECADLDI